MGLFDGIRDGIKMVGVMGAVIKGGIATAKVCEKMDQEILKISKEYGSILTPAQKSLYDQYNAARLKKLDSANGNENNDEDNNVEDEVEAAQVAFLMSMKGSGDLPRDFRDEIAATLKEYEEASGIAMNKFKEALLSAAETPEERAEVERQFAEELKQP